MVLVRHRCRYRRRNTSSDRTCPPTSLTSIDEGGDHVARCLYGNGGGCSRGPSFSAVVGRDVLQTTRRTGNRVIVPVSKAWWWSIQYPPHIRRAVMTTTTTTTIPHNGGGVLFPFGGHSEGRRVREILRYFYDVNGW